MSQYPSLDLNFTPAEEELDESSLILILKMVEETIIQQKKDVNMAMMELELAENLMNFYTNFREKVESMIDRADDYNFRANLRDIMVEAFFALAECQGKVSMKLTKVEALKMKLRYLQKRKFDLKTDLRRRYNHYVK